METALKILRIIIWILIMPLAVLVLGIFCWATSLLDFMED